MHRLAKRHDRINTPQRGAQMTLRKIEHWGKQRSEWRYSAVGAVFAEIERRQVHQTLTGYWPDPHHRHQWAIHSSYRSLVSLGLKVSPHLIAWVQVETKSAMANNCRNNKERMLTLYKLEPGIRPSAQMVVNCKNQSAMYRPLLPPSFSSKRTSLKVMPLSTALHMS